VRGVFVARRAQRSFRASSIASTRTPLAAWRRRFAPTRSNPWPASAASMRAEREIDRGKLGVHASREPAKP
jgi:hypothetical protein